MIQLVQQPPILPNKWSSSFSPLKIRSKRLNDIYIDRTDLDRDLDVHIQAMTQQGRGTVWIVADGGSGKTMLAEAAVERREKQHSWFFWVSASSADEMSIDLLDCMSETAKYVLDIDTDSGPTLAAVVTHFNELVRFAMTESNTPPPLLVIDNVAIWNENIMDAVIKLGGIPVVATTRIEPSAPEQFTAQLVWKSITDEELSRLTCKVLKTRHGLVKPEDREMLRKISDDRLFIMVRFLRAFGDHVLAHSHPQSWGQFIEASNLVDLAQLTRKSDGSDLTMEKLMRFELDILDILKADQVQLNEGIAKCLRVIGILRLKSIDEVFVKCVCGDKPTVVVAAVLGLLVKRPFIKHVAILDPNRGANNDGAPHLDADAWVIHDLVVDALCTVGPFETCVIDILRHWNPSTVSTMRSWLRSFTFISHRIFEADLSEFDNKACFISEVINARSVT